MENNYKPIMVWYVYVEHLQHLDKIREAADHTKLQLGYDILLFQVSDEKYARVEIVSVDKATVVEDIQKYIDLKFDNKSEEKSEDYIPDIDTTTYLGENKIPNVPKEQRANITRN